MSQKLREASAFRVAPPRVDASISLRDAKAAYAELLRTACQLGASPLTAGDIAEESKGALQLETVENYLSGKTAPPSPDGHQTLAGLIGTTLTLKGSERASEYADLRKKLDTAYRTVTAVRRKVGPRSPELPSTASSNSIQVAVLAAIQIGGMLELAIEHLRHFGAPLLFAPWEGFADNETSANDMFARLEPIDFDLLSRLAPLGIEPGLRIVNGFAELAKARRLLEDSLPNGGVDGVVVRLPWTEERDVKFKALLSAALEELLAAAVLCRNAGKAFGEK